MMPTLVGGRNRFAVFAGVAVAALCAPAAASPIEVFGFGPRHGGRAGTGTATADDFAALYYNPGGLALGSWLCGRSKRGVRPR